jgi:hypothetical protein
LVTGNRVIPVRRGVSEVCGTVSGEGVGGSEPCAEGERERDKEGEEVSMYLLSNQEAGAGTDADTGVCEEVVEVELVEGTVSGPRGCVR